MIKELDNFIQFLIDNRADERIRLVKKIKYGFRHYYLTFMIDGEPDQGNKNLFLQFNGSVEIVFDNRNRCIEIIDHLEENQVIVEDQELLEKWNPILEDMMNHNIGQKIQRVMESSLSACYKKDLYRIYQMNNLFDSGEEKEF